MKVYVGSIGSEIQVTVEGSEIRASLLNNTVSWDKLGMSPDRLVNLVCNRLLNHPIEDRTTRIIQPKRDIRPFDIANYDLHKFNPQDRVRKILIPIWSSIFRQAKTKN